MAVLIVGGAGYIGSHTNKLLHSLGIETIVLDNLDHGYESFVKWGKLIVGDMRDNILLKKIFMQEKIDAVMHFASFIEAGESVVDPQKYYLNNVAGTLNLLTAMREHHINRFIFSSTCAIYGAPSEIPITENCQKNPINPYGHTKLMIENILMDYANAYDFRYVSLRYFNAAGADPDGELGEDHHPETHLIPLVIEAALKKRDQVKIYGTDYPTKDGTCIRDYIHINDLAEAHVLALQYLLSGGKSDVFNIGNGLGFSVRDVIECVKKVSGKDIAVVEADKRPGDSPCLVAATDKIKRVLGWTPKYPELEIIIKSAWNWHNSH